MTSITLVKDPTLSRMLDTLGFHLENAGQFLKIEESSFEKLHVSRKFFEAFARLTQLNHTNGGAKRLFVPFPSDAIMAPVAQPIAPSPYLSQSPDVDFFIDEDEADVLKTVLSVLDKDEFFFEGVKVKKIRRPDLVLERMQSLSRSECWLSEENIQLGLLGHVNGLLHYLNIYFVDDGGNFTNLRGTSNPQLFTCEEIPSLTDIERGLFFNHIQSFPTGVQQAYQATVAMSFQPNWLRDAGSGVVIAQGYILSCDHSLQSRLEHGDTEPEKIIKKPDGSTWVVTDLTIHGIDYQGVELQVINIPPAPNTSYVDLKLFYWPDMPESIAKVKVTTQEPDPSQVQYVIGDKEFWEYGEPRIFSDRQEIPIIIHHDQLIAVGRPTKWAAKYLQGRNARGTSATALPGNSGGPIVNEQGELQGIIIEMLTDRTGRQPKIEEGNRVRSTSMGSVYLPMSFWWNNYILPALEKHRESQDK